MANEDPVARARALLASISPWPWTHFYPEHREARSGVIRPANKTETIGNVEVLSAPAIGIRYQVKAHAVNGQDRGAVATIWPPRSRNTGDWDRVGKEADDLAFAQTKADGDLIAAAPTLLAQLADQVERLRGEIAALKQPRTLKRMVRPVFPINESDYVNTNEHHHDPSGPCSICGDKG